MHQNYRWVIPQLDEGQVRHLAEALGCSAVLSRCLLNRKIRTAREAEAYLEPRLARLEDPHLLPDMETAVSRLVRARLRMESVVLYGDYDVDGVAATAILQEVMTALGWRVNSFVPSRFEEGYGLSVGGLHKCVDQHRPQVLLAVDCGSTSVEAVRWLNSAGVDVVIVDHHQLGEVLPPALALVNPRRERSQEAPGSELCSSGLAFKLAHALVKEGRLLEWREALSYDLRYLLDLTAIGTIADLVPLRRENRILVSAGLGKLSDTRRAGLQAIMRIAGSRSSLGVGDVAFQIAPRLNAAGRLDTAADALGLLLTCDMAEAEMLAKKLDAWNRERQRMEREMAEEAIEQVRGRFNASNDYVIVEGREDWHVGVVGIVAARVVREFYRPTVILGGDGSVWRGSGRSIAGFDLGAALRDCRDHVLRHGGHAMAAGVTLRPDQVDGLRGRLNLLARERLSVEELSPALRLDGEVILGDLGLPLVKELRRLDPIGQGNAEVRVVVRGVELVGGIRWMGNEGKHARMKVCQGTATAEAVWWSCAGKPTPANRFDLAVTPELNEYQGRSTVQLRVLDWRPAIGACVRT